MEYAFEEYGYSVERVLHGQLARRGGRYDEFLAHLDDLSQPWEEDSLEALASNWRGGLGDGEDLPGERPPELLAALRSRTGPGVALRTAIATKAAFDELRHSRALRITHCSLEQDEQGTERMLLGVYSPALCDGVREGDEVNAGVLVALHGEPRNRWRLEVLPRLYRKVCLNGLMRISTGPAQALVQYALLNSEAPEQLTGAIKQLTAVCFAPEQFKTAVQHLRRSASESIEDALEVLLAAQLRPDVADTVVRRYRAQGDLTRWGLVNAVTAEARTASSALMLDLEKRGGCLARVPPVVARSTAPGPSLPRESKRTVA